MHGASCRMIFDALSQWVKLQDGRIENIPYFAPQLDAAREQPYEEQDWKTLVDIMMFLNVGRHHATLRDCMVPYCT